MNTAVAAVLWPGRKDMAIEQVELDDPRAGEVLVEIAACGICHTDMVMRDQGVPTPQPVVLGHEGVGTVVKVGAGVGNLAVGDLVVLSFATCGQCPCCVRGQVAYCHQFFPLNFFGARADGSTSIRCEGAPIHSHIFGQSSFATRVVCSARNAVRVADDIPLGLLAPFGCGFQTGAGAVLNSLQVRAGSSVMIFGAGAVGLSAVMAARIAGATTIIAVDIIGARLDLALDVGATQVIDTRSQDLAASVRSICPGGVDYIIDTTAHLPLVQQAASLLAHRGSLGLAAAYRPGDSFSLDLIPFMSTGLTVRGIVEGDTDIHGFIPQLVEYHRQGRFPVEKIIKYFDFADINAAIAASESGAVVKAVVLMR